MSEATPDDTKYHCLEACWLHSPFSPQEDKRNPPRDTAMRYWKISHQTQLTETQWEPFLLQSSVQEHSWACAEALWGPLIAPWSLRAPFPSAPAPPGDTVCPLSSTQAGIQHLLRTFCWLNFICTSTRDLLLLLHGLAYWLCPLSFPTLWLLLLDHGGQEKRVSNPFLFSAVSQQKKHYHIRLPDNMPQRFSHILLLSFLFLFQEIKRWVTDFREGGEGFMLSSATVTSLSFTLEWEGALNWGCKANSLSTKPLAN